MKPGNNWKGEPKTELFGYLWSVDFVSGVVIGLSKPVGYLMVEQKAQETLYGTLISHTTKNSRYSSNITKTCITSYLLILLFRKTKDHTVECLSIFKGIFVQR